jgi:endonuclease YncB( thermonuclease family)
LDEFAEYRRRLRTPRKARYWRYLPLGAGLVMGTVAIFLAIRFLPGLVSATVRNSEPAGSATVEESESADSASSMDVNAGFTLCAEQYQANCVVDGDTIHFNNTRIRIEDIDAPETHRPRCSYELALGERATTRLLELLNTGPFQIIYSGGRDTDIYGRELRVIERDGQSLGGILVSEGLARIWDGARHPWCN